MEDEVKRVPPVARRVDMKEKPMNRVLHQRPEESAEDEAGKQLALASCVAFAPLQRHPIAIDDDGYPNDRHDSPVRLGELLAELALEKPRLPELRPMHPLLVLFLKLPYLEHHWLSKIYLQGLLLPLLVCRRW